MIKIIKYLLVVMVSCSCSNEFKNITLESELYSVDDILLKIEEQDIFLKEKKVQYFSEKTNFNKILPKYLPLDKIETINISHKTFYSFKIDSFPCALYMDVYWLPTQNQADFLFDQLINENNNAYFTFNYTYSNLHFFRAKNGVILLQNHCYHHKIIDFSVDENHYILFTG